MNNTNKTLRLVSVTDRAGNSLYSTDSCSEPLASLDDPLDSPRALAHRLLAERQQRLATPLPAPALRPCPRDAHHTARALAGGNHVWCPRCQQVLPLTGQAEPELFSRASLYATWGLLAVWLTVLVGAIGYMVLSL